jgi:hypothetical protein
LTNDYIVKYQYSGTVLARDPANPGRQENVEMQPGQMAVVWMMYDQFQRSEAAMPTAHASPRPSFKQRLGRKFRRFAFRTQLGPVGGHAAV